jgi:nitrite reductase (NADH) large subunit
MKKLKLVMVGNGMAGVRTLEELLAIAPDRYEITVFGAEPYANYNRILLSPVLAGEQSIPDIMLNDVDWYRQNGIILHLGKKITKIDRARRVVIAPRLPMTGCCSRPVPILSCCRYPATAWTA